MDIVSYVRDISGDFGDDDSQHDNDHYHTPAQQPTGLDIATLANPNHNHPPSATVDYQPCLPELTSHSNNTIEGQTTTETATQPTENLVSAFDTLFMFLTLHTLYSLHT